MRKLTDNQWEVLMHWLLTLVGGFMGTYAVLLHAGNFGSAQTGKHYGNGGRSDFDGMVEGAASIDCIHHFRFRCGIRLSFDQLYEIEHAKAGLVGRCSRINTGVTDPAGSGVGGPLSDFLLCFLSVGVYSAAGGFNSASIFTTNNYKQALLGWTQYILTKDKEFLRKGIIYTFTVLSFFGGACLGAWSVYILNVRGAYVAFIPLVLARILIAVGESPAEDETPAELAAEATEEAEEAVLLEEELPKELPK